MELISSGGDVWGTADAFQFAYQSVTGDTTIVARVDTLEMTETWAKAGLMIRQDLSAGSIQNAIMINAGGGNGIGVRTRGTVNGGTGYNQVLPNATAPYWLRMVRTGNTIVTSYSIDGATWTTAATNTLALNATVYVGLASTSASSSQLNTSTFSNVSIAGIATLPAAPSNLTVAKSSRKAILNWRDNSTTKPASASGPAVTARTGRCSRLARLARQAAARRRTPPPTSRWDCGTSASAPATPLASRHTATSPAS